MRVAIYSGYTHSGTFINNLIYSVGDQGVDILILGKNNGKPILHKNVNYCTTPSRYSLLPYFVLFQSIKLFFADTVIWNKLNFERKKLNLSIKESILWLSKTLPVINNLPDIFHIQWAHAVNDWMFLQQFGVKVICSLRGSQITWSPICDNLVKNRYLDNFPQIDGFHAVSQSIARDAAQYGAPLENIKVVYSGVNLEAIDELKTAEVQNGKNANSNDSFNNPLKIISVGRVHWVKGYKYAIDACKILQGEHPAFDYTIIAPGDNTELRYHILDLGLEEKVFIKSGMAHSQVLQEIGEADVLLLPSVSEGIANVVLEAMAMGTIVVTSDCGGMKEVVQDKKNGFVVPIRDSRAIADTLTNIVSLSATNLKEIRQRAAETIYRDFNLGRLGIEMKSFYSSVMNR